MSRTSHTEVVPEHVREHETTVEDRYCDFPGCGVLIKLEWWENLPGKPYAHELVVYLDPEECVSFQHRRDYCPAHEQVVWTAICAAIGADPDAERSGWDE
jgi:hypothetical protein